ncbi:MAG: hypothetical protein Q8930_01735 [Bacillota bacterium]|nr:hypothetical protein [Bacillota bacterium]
MKLKKYDYVFLSILVIIITFTVSFRSAVKIYGEGSKSTKSGTQNIGKLTSGTALEKILADNTVILLQLQKDGEVISTKKISVAEMKRDMTGECTLTNLKKYYLSRNFNFLSEGSDGITFIKESKCIPQKYYLGITDEGFAAIFKCNNEGVLFIEDKFNDVSDRDAESLQETDKKALENNDYQFDTKDDALDALMEICS